MTVPLYKDHHPFTYSASGNAGLWYNKFCNTWELSWNKLDKNKWINTVTGSCVGDRGIISEFLNRQGRLVSSLKGRVLFFRTQDRFVTGLGNAHPVDNGFTWHHSLGTPCLPGSTVKGIVRAWAETFGPRDAALISNIFGPEKKDSFPVHVGNAIFFDAVPVVPVRLDADIMTPHYQSYYQRKPGSPPSDWYSPVPIPFLTVAPGQRFAFMLAPRRADWGISIDEIADWLVKALEDIGAGAKASSGYGRFVYDENATITFSNQLREEIDDLNRAKMSAIRNEMENDHFGDEVAFMNSLVNKWLPRLSSPDISVEDKAEIAYHLKSWYLIFRPNQWMSPKKKNISKVESIRLALKE